MTKIALLLSGNIRTFFYKNNLIAKNYLELINNQDIDLFVYTDNNDFNHNDIQYFSENNKEKILGIPNDYEKRISKNIQFINYNDSYTIIKENFFKIFENKLKKITVEDFDPNKINTIYDKNNIYHRTFMNFNTDYNRKKALMCQFYKLYKCYNLLCDYEKENNLKYDIIIKSRFDIILTNLNNYDIRTFDLNNQIYCYNFGTFISDVWAIGNRFIMDKYCNYYLTISPNLIDGVYNFLHIKGNWIIINSENYIDYEKDNKNNIEFEASYGGEFGLTYLIKYKNNYNINHLELSEISYKFYE